MAYTFLAGAASILSLWLYACVQLLRDVSHHAALQMRNYACLSRLANWSWNSLNKAAVVPLSRLIAKVVLALSAKKASDLSGRWSCLTLHTHKRIIQCLCVIRKPLRAFIIIIISQTATHMIKISEKWLCIKWKIIPISAAAFVGLYAVNPCENTY